MNKDECKRFSDILMAVGVGMLIGGLFQLGVNSEFLTWAGAAGLIIGSYLMLRFGGEV